MKKIYILGWGKSGQGAYKFLKNDNVEISVFDKRFRGREKSNNKNLFYYSDIETPSFTGVELLVVSPGITPDHPLVLMAKKYNLSILSEIEIGLKYLKDKNKIIIGVTGTNGKTTFTSHLETLATSLDIKAKALGNIGESLCSYLSKNKNLDQIDVLILELSSYQLQNLKVKIFDIAIILNITPDHLSYHGSYEKYCLAKLQILNCLKASGELIVSKQVFADFINNNENRNSSLQYKVVPNINLFITHDDKHEIIHLYYYILSKLKKVSTDIIKKQFAKLANIEHRIEHVLNIAGINFFNDSKSTNPASTIFAINNLSAPIILIAGGEDKGLSYFLWNENFKNKVKAVFLIGTCAKKIAKELDGIDTYIAIKIEDAVEMAYRYAKAGDNILLSPGCSSQDQFENYEHRGQKFKKIVKSLENEVGKK